jgi:uncharacterized protein YjbI with pentapeptide repeats
MEFKILNRFSGKVQFTAEIDCKEDEATSIKIGLSVKWAIKTSANLRYANLSSADLSYANLSSADLRSADLSSANLRYADLRSANLSSADLSSANLRYADLSSANLRYANLRYADLRYADLRYADLRYADLSYANLRSADLTETKAMVKIMGVEQGNTYWKRFERGLKNNEYQFRVGLNELRSGEVFADDERVTCSYPGFHFASRSWCSVYYSDRPLEAKIRIPMDAKINEPWATDGKASADKIEIIQVFEVATGKDVTDEINKEW